MRNEHLSDLERFGFKQRKDGSLIYRDKEKKRDALSYKMQSVGNCPHKEIVYETSICGNACARLPRVLA